MVQVTHIDYTYISKTDLCFRSGKIYLSENADLISTEKVPKKFNVTVFAIDSGMPFRETAQATIVVHVQDVNNEPPVFKKDQNYVSRISEEISIGTVVSKVWCSVLL